MASKRADQKFDKLVKELKHDPNILAFYLAGSRAKGMLTRRSDYDFVILTDETFRNGYKKKYSEYFNDPEFDISIMTIDELKKYANYGTDMAWDRFNFSYLEVLHDKTGKVQRIIDQKTVVSKKEAKQIINGNLDAFINQIYRAAKCRRDGNIIAAHFEAAEAIPWFLNCVFALEYRIKPYHKYLKWELEQHPLKKLPWKKGELIKKLHKILQNGDEGSLMEIFKKTRPIFRKAGYGKIYDGWSGKYKVG